MSFCIEKPINFHGNNCELELNKIVRVRNANFINGHVVGIMDTVTAYATGKNREKQKFGEFGSSGGQAAKRYSKGVADSLHHQQEYAPCKTIFPEDEK